MSRARPLISSAGIHPGGHPPDGFRSRRRPRTGATPRSAAGSSVPPPSSPHWSRAASARRSCAAGGIATNTRSAVVRYRVHRHRPRHRPDEARHGRQRAALTDCLLSKNFSTCGSPRVPGRGTCPHPDVTGQGRRAVGGERGVVSGPAAAFWLGMLPNAPMEDRHRPPRRPGRRRDRRLGLAIRCRSLPHRPDKGNALVSAGWTVLRFTWHDLTSRPDYVLAQIKAALLTAAANA